MKNSLLKEETIGHERIQLLEAVAREGSISAAARARGISYKTAWDSLNVMQNLIKYPLLEKNTGGRKGGGTTLTQQGVQLIETFHKLEAGLATLFHNVSDELNTIGVSSKGLLHGFMMRSSARNVFSGRIDSFKQTKNEANTFDKTNYKSAINTLLHIRIAHNIMMQSIITLKSVKNLGLVKGRDVSLLIKSTFIDVKPAPILNEIQKDNHFQGIIRDNFKGRDMNELTIDIGEQKTMIATLSKTHPCADYAPNKAVIVSFKPQHSLIATY
ncbi:LysR family transcriptional regulator [Bartonella tamiae]|uniref:ModE molybdate transport repressor domain-containing protein n=1 Tax=Bartonella tamiae Th239 TaxID=1094558 RepID=J0QZJ7_9HYPH|nr:LysR family transcriptional regulator [Bartonella tamiae]EJF91576.1 ModE molybdate transport repressor domain-containing protein [Bartonella tamiae Th239]EJF92440.1 ModE molybdate transport repressor domain-containing protein [Bartonella tamiae Th307]